MSDLFLSYAHSDIKMAETLAALLEANGLSVWWDRRLYPGDKFHDLIEGELGKAKAVLVLWSPSSVKSDWVLGEAQTARELDKLIPVKIADCKLPLPYRAIHTPDIFRTKAELDDLARILTARLRPETAAAGPAPAPKIEISANSATTFLSQFAAFNQESRAMRRAVKPLDVRTWTVGNLVADYMSLPKLAWKYPRAAVATGVLCLVIVTCFQLAAGVGFSGDDVAPNLGAGLLGLVLFGVWCGHYYGWIGKWKQ